MINAAALYAACEWLTGKFFASGNCDFSEVVVVSQLSAGDRLLELLAWRAQIRKLECRDCCCSHRALSTPVVCRNSSARRLNLWQARSRANWRGWRRCSRNSHGSSATTIVATAPKGRATALAEPGRRTGQVTSRTWRASKWSWTGCWPTAPPRKLNASWARWRAFDAIREKYRALLQPHRRADKFDSRAQRLQGGGWASELTFVLLAVAELPGLTAAMLRQAPGPVHALVYAPPSKADGFDDVGCLVGQKSGPGRDSRHPMAGVQRRKRRSAGPAQLGEDGPSS